MSVAAAAARNTRLEACARVVGSALLLLRAQAKGTARTDMNEDDLFGLMAALGWLVDLRATAGSSRHGSSLPSALTARADRGAIAPLLLGTQPWPPPFLPWEFSN